MTRRADRALGRRPTLLGTVTAIFGLAALAGFSGVWWWWGVGFEEAETLGMARPGTDALMVASFWVAIAGLAGLAAAWLLHVVSRVTRGHG